MGKLEGDLNRLLARLESRLAQSPATTLECVKISANVEYGRKLLLQWQSRDENRLKHTDKFQLYQDRIRLLNERLQTYEKNIPPLSAPEEMQIELINTESNGSLFDGELRNRRATATHEHVLSQHCQTQEQLTDDLLRMSTALKSNAVNFNEKLEKDATTVEGTGQLLQRNADAMKKTGGSLGQYSKQSGSTFWLLIGATAATIVLFFFDMALIALT